MHRRGPKRMSTPLDELDMELEVLKKKRMMLQQERQLIEERQQLQRMQQQYGSGVWEQPFQNQNIPSLMAAPTTFGGSDNSPFGGYGYDNISASNKRAPRSNRRRGGGPRSEPSRNRPEDNRSGQQPPSRGNPIRKSNDLPPPKRQAQPMSQAASNPPFQTAKKGMSLGIFKPGEISIQAQSRFGNVISTIFREIKAAFESKYDFLPSISAALKDLIRANVHEMMAFKEIVHQNEIIEMYRKCYPLSTDEPLLRKAIEAERKRQPLPKRVKPERQQYTDELKKLIEERKKAREELVMNAKLIQQRVLTHLPKLVDEIVLKFVDPTKPPHDADELDDADVTEIDNEQSEEKPNNDTAENASVQDNAVSDEINAVVDENKAVADEANTGVADVANAVVSDEATAVQDGEFGDAAGDVTASTGIKTNNATNEESDEKEEHTKKKAIEIANMSDNDLANLLRANLVNTMYKARPMLQTMLSKFWRSLVGNSLGDDQGRLVMSSEGNYSTLYTLKPAAAQDVPKPMRFLIDMDGFQIKKKFYPKEVAVQDMHCNKTYLWFIKLPENLTADNNTIWETKNVHGLNFENSNDDIEYETFLTKLDELDRYRNFVWCYKGGCEEKKLLTQNHFFSYNIELMGCPKFELLEPAVMESVCNRHTSFKPFHKSKIGKPCHCAAVEVLTFANWIRDYVKLA